jgi:hypothetical protein
MATEINELEVSSLNDKHILKIEAEILNDKALLWKLSQEDGHDDWLLDKKLN